MTDNNHLASEEELFGKKPARRYCELTMPISGHRVRIQSLTERELSRYQMATLASSGTGLKRSRLEDANRRLIVLCLVDSAGNRLLNDSHLERLAEWDAADTAYLYDQCASHCGINRQDIEDLAKNSAAIHVVDSGFSSPSE